MSDSEAPTRYVSSHSSVGVADATSLPTAESASAFDFQSAWTDPPPPNADQDPLLNSVLSRTYRIVRVIGEGGMGRVYEARHTRIRKKRYAIKVLHPEFARDPEVLTRFQREAEAAACLSHPCAVGVYDVALTPQGWPYLVCEFLEGVDLAQFIKTHGALPAGTARHIALQVCDALVDAHANGVVHRDLKPQNVFLVGDFGDTMPERPNAKVLDFGLSRFLDSSDSELTRTGVIMGTPSYMSPEQARGERVDHRADVYGVGALLYACVTGKAPFRAETPQATVLAVMNDEPARPSKLNPAVTPQAELLIARAMERDLNQRYPDMQSLREDLERLEVGDGGQPRSAREGPAGPRVLQQTVHLELQSSRPQLLLLAAVISAGTLMALLTALCGVVLLVYERWPLTRVETMLSALLVAGTLLTPALLWMRRFRRQVWGNTARVVELSSRLRHAAMVGLGTFGVGALVITFIDTVVIRAAGRGATSAEHAALGWPGTGPLLVASAALMTAVWLMRQSALAQGGWVSQAKTPLGARGRRFLAGPGLTAAGVLLVLGVFASGLSWRSGSPIWQDQSIAGWMRASGVQASTAAAANPPPVFAFSDAGTTEAVTPLPSAATTVPPPPSASAAPTEPEPARAGRAALSAAVSRGLEQGLLPLAKEFPEDPDVLRALAVAQASSSATLVEAMASLRRLFDVRPEAAEDAELQRIILQTTRIARARRAAFQLLADGMGSVGPDVLYKVSLTQPEQRDEARRYLAQSGVRQKFTPALAIAYDLQFAQSCAARVPLLERARQFGDERSIRVLAPLATSRKTGCGYKKRKPCRAPCSAQAEAFLEVVDHISARLQSSPSKG